MVRRRCFGGWRMFCGGLIYGADDSLKTRFGWFREENICLPCFVREDFEIFLFKNFIEMILKI